MLFNVRSSFQEKDLCCLSLSSFSCRVSSFCRFTPREWGSSFVRVCFKRCHCAPSMLKGPDGKYTVAMPCVVTAWTGPMDVSQNSGSSKIRTAPISGGFLIDSNMSSLTRFLSLRTCGSLAAWGTENLSLSGEGFIFITWAISGCSSPQV